MTEKKFVQQLSALYDVDEAMNIYRLIKNYLSDHPNAPLTVEHIFERLLTGEPVQYILREAWFYDIPFYVDQSVLIPRPETEELTNWIIKDHSQNSSGKTILDIGTGSGCIPVILKRKIPNAIIYACDISQSALEIAKKNANDHHISVSFIQTDFLNPENYFTLPDTDILVSNPPYIPISEKTGMDKNVAGFEPAIALFVEDNNPLIYYQRIITFAENKLRNDGNIYLEIHENFGQDVLQLFLTSGYNTILKKDMQGKDRMIKAIKKAR